MPRNMKMTKIKRILKLAEENKDFSERKLVKIVGCSKNTIKVIRTTEKNLVLLAIQ
jgi:DNA-binding Xre family transcriptional regulator